uniref:hypothetical protein n=1 Tax=Nocardia abscessus TaxID=120957 RepID=UPI002453EB28
MELTKIALETGFRPAVRLSIHIADRQSAPGPFAPGRDASGSRRQTRPQIGEEVNETHEADRQPDHARRYARGQQLIR